MKQRWFMPDLIGGQPISNPDGTTLQQWRWATAGGAFNLLGNGRANMTFSPIADTHGADELAVGILVDNVAGGASFFLNVRWGDSNARALGSQDYEETQLGTVVLVGGIAQIPLNPIDYGPIPSGNNGANGQQKILYLPVGAHYVKFGVYCNGAPLANQFLNLSLFRRVPSTLQNTGA